MLIQVITGSSEYDEPTELLIQEIFSTKGHKVSFVPIVNSIRIGESNRPLNGITSQANITIVLSGLRWFDYSKRIPAEFLPNTIVVTSNPVLQDAWEITPVAVVSWDKFLKKNIVLAVNALTNLPVRYPARSKGFRQVEFGWMRGPIVEDTFAVRAWKALHEELWPGYKFSTWSAKKGDLTGAFEIISLAEDSVTVRSSVAKNLQIVPKEDFFELAVDWEEYKLGNISRHELRDKTRYSTYIIGLLHWLDIEGHLK